MPMSQPGGAILEVGGVVIGERNGDVYMYVPVSLFYTTGVPWAWVVRAQSNVIERNFHTDSCVGT